VASSSPCVVQISFNIYVETDLILIHDLNQALSRHMLVDQSEMRPDRFGPTALLPGQGLMQPRCETADVSRPRKDRDPGCCEAQSAFSCRQASHPLADRVAHLLTAHDKIRVSVDLVSRHPDSSRNWGR
jgi:hypothetical protein